MKEERRDRKVETSAGLFGRWRASFRWAGRRPVGPGEEWEGKDRISLRTFSGVRPCGKGLPSGRQPKSEVLEGVGWRSWSFLNARAGSIGGGGGVRRRRALVSEPERVAWIACCKWLSLGGVAVGEQGGPGESWGETADQRDSQWPWRKVRMALVT